MKNKVYQIVFKNSSKPYLFQSEIDLANEMEVIVDTEKGEQYGKVVGLVSDPNDKEEYSHVLRIATEEDTKCFYKNLKDADSALKKCKDLVKEMGLDMYLINAQFSFDRSQLLLSFTADDRVDFRDLARKMASIYRTRIELRQVGARDKAKQIGGIGICGQKLCCANFLNQIDSISMNRAKNQNLALNPSKINGACGRLLCCLCYEDDEYVRCSAGLLPIGTKINYNGEEAQIIGVDILTRTYKAIINDEKVMIKHEEIKNDRKK